MESLPGLCAPPKGLRLHAWFLPVLFCLTSPQYLWAGQSPTKDSAPFLNLRENQLEYRGPTADLTNLTEIRIGWFGPTNLDDPLTGGLWRAATLAVRAANDQDISSSTVRHASLQGLPFRLIPCWTANPWGSGVSQLARMVYEEQPLALLGSIDSATTHLAEQIVAKAQLPLVSPVSTDQTVTLAGVPWMFSSAPSDKAIARLLASEILATPWGNQIRLALLTTTDHESRMTTTEVLKELARRGRQPDYRFDVTPGAHDVAQHMSALEKARPSAVLILAGIEDAARLLRLAREQVGPIPVSTGEASPAPGESPCLFFGSQSMARARFRELAGPAAEGVRFPLLFVPDPADASTASFVDRFAREHQRPPDYTEALTYDATRLLLEAVRRAGPNRARVRDALIELSPWRGITGLIAFDGTGQNQRTNLSMGTIRNGMVVPLSRGIVVQTTHNPKGKP